MLRIEKPEARCPAALLLGHFFSFPNCLHDRGIECHCRTQHEQEDDVVCHGPHVVDLTHFFKRIDPAEWEPYFINFSPQPVVDQCDHMAKFLQNIGSSTTMKTCPIVYTFFLQQDQNFAKS